MKAAACACQDGRRCPSARPPPLPPRRKSTSKISRRTALESWSTSSTGHTTPAAAGTATRRRPPRWSRPAGRAAAPRQWRHRCPPIGSQVRTNRRRATALPAPPDRGRPRRSRARRSRARPRVPPARLRLSGSRRSSPAMVRCQSRSNSRASARSSTSCPFRGTRAPTERMAQVGPPEPVLRGRSSAPGATTAIRDASTPNASISRVRVASEVAISFRSAGSRRRCASRTCASASAIGAG